MPSAVEKRVFGQRPAWKGLWELARSLLWQFLAVWQSVAAGATIRVGYPQPSGDAAAVARDGSQARSNTARVQNIFISGAARELVDDAGDIDLASTARW
jgi:hypothetical protein